jgi:hypothetical protein
MGRIKDNVPFYLNLYSDVLLLHRMHLRKSTTRFGIRENSCIIHGKFMYHTRNMLLIF